MGTGILVCGLNGAGKSTLGRVLAARLNFEFIDNEDLFFPNKGGDYEYAAPLPREEVETQLLREFKTHENFVFAAVKGNYGDAVYPFFDYAVLIELPRDIRLKRVRDRSFKQFGGRIFEGGDLYEREKKFFELVEARAEDSVEKWLENLSCPVIRVDGTKSIEENADFIIKEIEKPREGIL